MSVLRQQGRPRCGPLSVGREKIIADTLDLLRRRETFATRKELASKIGITPALINYYFGSKCDFIGDPIRQLVEGHARHFHQAISPLRQECRAAVRSVVPIVVKMYLQDGPLLVRYADLAADDPTNCAIKRMKRDLASILTDAEEDAMLEDHAAAAMAAVIWGACSAVEDEMGMLMCIEMADRLIVARDNLRRAGRAETVGMHARALNCASPIACHICSSASIRGHLEAGA